MTWKLPDYGYIVSNNRACPSIALDTMSPGFDVLADEPVNVPINIHIIDVEY